jgi:ribosome maturation factor RimP
MVMGDTVKRILAIVAPIVAEEGCELIDVALATEPGQRILRVFIDRPEGVKLEDCARVSHAIEDVIEVEGRVQGRYHLEVSSPGLDRPLRVPAHFDRVVGRVVRLTTQEPLHGRRNFKGVLKGWRGTGGEGDELVIHIDKEDFYVPFAAVMKAHLVSES